MVMAPTAHAPVQTQTILSHDHTHQTLFFAPAQTLDDADTPVGALLSFYDICTNIQAVVVLANLDGQCAPSRSTLLILTCNLAASKFFVTPEALNLNNRRWSEAEPADGAPHESQPRMGLNSHGQAQNGGFSRANGCVQPLRG